MNLTLLCRLISRSNPGSVSRACSSSARKPFPDVEGPPTSARAVDEETITHLERLSLVDFANKRGVARLEEAIQFANQLDAVDTTGIEPLVSVLEEEILSLREDKVSEVNKVSVLLSTASFSEEDYYVAPPGNIPVASSDPSKLK